MKIKYYKKKFYKEWLGNLIKELVNLCIFDKNLVKINIIKIKLNGKLQRK